MSAQPVETATHGIHVDGGLVTATCIFHGLRASAPLGVGDDFVRRAWVRHMTRECLTSLIEEQAQTQVDAQGEIVAYVLPVELWRQIRAAIERAHHAAPSG